MPSNGYTENNVLYVDGTATWADLTGNWSTYDSWTQYTGADYGGAPGVPLRYQTAIIDFGEVKTVVPRITVGTTGDSLVTIEYSNNADMSSATTMSPYTSDNTDTGTLTHFWVLNWCKPGYISEYEDFTARYARVTVYVENFNSDGTERLAPALNNLYILFENPVWQEEKLYDQDTSTYSGSVSARVIPFDLITNLKGVFLTAHKAGANDVLSPQVVSKSNKTVRLLKYDGTSVAETDGTIDILAYGTPIIDVFENGVIRPREI